MGFLNQEILLDSPTGAYYSGQMVNGTLAFTLSNVTQIRGIHITAKGYCNVHWTTSHSRRVEGRTEHYTVPHESYEDYICLKMYLLGNKNTEHTLHPGKFEYPFSFQLPDTCPSSFEGSRGHVRYIIQGFIDLPYGAEELVREFKVHAPLDLNQIECKEPVSFDFDQSYCCWCISSGSSETVVKIPVSGYCPGQVIPIEVFCQNRSGVEIDTIRFAIKKEITYHASREPGTENERETVEETKQGPVPPHTDRRWTVEMAVPAIDVYNLNTCSYIDIEYEFKVTVEPSGCHSNDDDKCALIIGTIPLVGYQDNVANPLQDQLPQVTVTPQNYPPVNGAYPQPVINQPVTTYPTNSPYPNPQPSPYPSPNPYPVPQPNVMPYPVPQPNVAPYPVPQPNVTPYPVPQPNVTPYPVPQPYPSPQPGLNPYAPAPHPQPNNSPYLPQPGHSPFPSHQPITAPYPIVPPASPMVQNSPLVKSGDIGMVVGDRDPASMPLLPVGAAVPYPTRPVSPYADASAPSDKPTEANPNSSPYNPAFMNSDNKEEAVKEEKK